VATSKHIFTSLNEKQFLVILFLNKSCTCPPLFTGSRCDIRISYCSSSPCLNGGTCLDTQFGFVCTCPIGYEGILCTNLINVSFKKCFLGLSKNFNSNFQSKNCVSNPCSNGGTCMNGLNTFTCQCPSSYTGPTCQVYINYCASSPCQNNSTCINQIGSYSCLCQTGKDLYKIL